MDIHISVINVGVLISLIMVLGHVNNVSIGNVWNVMEEKNKKGLIDKYKNGKDRKRERDEKDFLTQSNKRWKDTKEEKETKKL